STHSPAPSPPPATASAAPGAPMLLVDGILALLALARALPVIPHPMAAWGLNVLRFVPPVPGWTLCAPSALALAPPVARVLAPSLARIGAPLERGAWGYVPWVLAPMALVWALPDRLMFAGDFLLRETSGQEAHSIFRTLYPQGLPLDQLLHD